MSTAGLIILIAALFVGYEGWKLVSQGKSALPSALTKSNEQNGAQGVSATGGTTVSANTRQLSQSQFSSLLSQAASIVGVSDQWAQNAGQVTSLYEDQGLYVSGPNSVNPKSGAFGLFQFLPSTWQDYLSQYGSSGYTDPNDPLSQVVAGLRYIRDRYGTPGAALAHEQEYGWY